MKKSSRLITIAIPNYNNGKYITLALESVFSQTKNEFDLIISDNFSTDSSLKKIQAVNDAIKIITPSEFLTYEMHLEFILSEVTTPYVVFFAGDDVLDENFIDRATSILKNNNVHDALLFKCNPFSEEMCNYVNVEYGIYEKLKHFIPKSILGANGPIGNISGNVYSVNFLTNLFERNRKEVSFAGPSIDHLITLLACQKSCKTHIGMYASVYYRVHDGVWGPNKTYDFSIRHANFCMKMIGSQNISMISKLGLLVRSLLSFYAASKEKKIVS